MDCLTGSHYFPLAMLFIAILVGLYVAGLISTKKINDDIKAATEEADRRDRMTGHSITRDSNVITLEIGTETSPVSSESYKLDYEFTLTYRDKE